MTTASPLQPPIPNAYVVPGTRLAAGEYPGSPPSNPTSDLEAKLARFLDAGVTAYVDLTDPRDGLEPYEHALRAIAAGRGVAVAYDRCTIRDMDVCDDGRMREILDLIDHRLREGHGVYVHCWGGVGRTGTTVGCWLVRHGTRGEAALAEVSRLFATMSPGKVRRHADWGSPQTDDQREMVRRWERVEGARAAGRRAAGAGAPLSYVLGGLLGGAVGDALGWPVEFLRLDEIRRRYGADGIQDFAGDAPGGLGAITDDTQMTLFTAEGILRSTVRRMERTGMRDGSRDDWEGLHRPLPGVMHGAYLRWLHTQVPHAAGLAARPDLPGDGEPGWLVRERRLHVERAPGNTCLSALRHREPGSRDRPLNDSKGCGGVMRVAPIGLVPCEDPFDDAVTAAALTHGHPSGHLPAGAYARIVADLLFERAPLEEAVRRALDRLAREPGHEETTAALGAALHLARQGDPSAERVESLGGGWVGEEALAIGVYCALVAEDFAHGVRLAVNHSGDSDSTGSIAGALLGVRDGIDAVPAGWRATVELRDVLATMAEDLVVGYAGTAAWRERYPGS